MTATTRSLGRIGWAATALFLLIGVAIALVGWARPARKPLDQARDAYAKGDWDRALALVRAIIKSTPTADPEVWRLYARSLARLNRDEAASTIFKDRVGQSAMMPEDQFLAGLALVHAGKLDLALAVWQKAMQAGPDFPELIDHLARLSYRLQHLDESAEAARKLALQPGWEAKGWLLLAKPRPSSIIPQALSRRYGRGSNMIRKRGAFLSTWAIINCFWLVYSSKLVVRRRPRYPFKP